MPAHPEIIAIAEQALGHILKEQQKILSHSDAESVVKVATLLNQLAFQTYEQIQNDFNRRTSIAQLVRLARRIEKTADDLSEVIWKPIPISVSAIYENLDECLGQSHGSNTPKGIRDHYHNIRIRLLEQTLGARMFVQNSDLGEENERIWQQFLQNQLGANFQVLRGGHILGYDGSRSGSQIDIIITSSGASVVIPGESDGGKANVFIGDMIAAIMLTTNLSPAKLKADWIGLQTLPEFPDKAKDFPSLRDHCWPLSYIFGSQSSAIEELSTQWVENVKTGACKVFPQLLVSLDGGSFFSGAMAWPRPRYPGNYTQADQVKTWTGLDAGLGLAWAILQIKGRLGAMENRGLNPITRFARLLDAVDIKPVFPPTWSPRFNTMSQQTEIGGIFRWGSTSRFAHNRLQLKSVRRDLPGKERIIDVELFKPNIELEALGWMERSKHLRWFEYGLAEVSGDTVVFREWLDPFSEKQHKSRSVTFNIHTGVELMEEGM